MLPRIFSFIEWLYSIIKSALIVKELLYSAFLRFFSRSLGLAGSIIPLKCIIVMTKHEKYSYFNLTGNSIVLILFTASVAFIFFGLFFQRLSTSYLEKYHELRSCCDSSIIIEHVVNIISDILFCMFMLGLILVVYPLSSITLLGCSYFFTLIVLRHKYSAIKKMLMPELAVNLANVGFFVMFSFVVACYFLYVVPSIILILIGLISSRQFFLRFTKMLEAIKEIHTYKKNERNV